MILGSKPQKRKTRHTHILVFDTLMFEPVAKWHERARRRVAEDAG